jgi:hypothetical protein
MLATVSSPYPCAAIKLDFKNPEVVEISLDLISRNAYWSAPGCVPPVWLNADVCTGPGLRPSAFDGPQFVQQCLAKRPQDTLSLGWTVHHATMDVLR